MGIAHEPQGIAGTAVARAAFSDGMANPRPNQVGQRSKSCSTSLNTTGTPTHHSAVEGWDQDAPEELGVEAPWAAGAATRLVGWGRGRVGDCWTSGAFLKNTEGCGGGQWVCGVSSPVRGKQDD